MEEKKYKWTRRPKPDTLVTKDRTKELANALVDHFKGDREAARLWVTCISKKTFDSWCRGSYAMAAERRDRIEKFLAEQPPK